MICIKKFLYSVAFVFLFFVFTVFGISPNTNAASSSFSFTASDISSGSNVSFSTLGFDGSSLDSSKDWYYTVSFKASSSVTSIRFPHFTCGTGYNYNRSLCSFSPFSGSIFVNTSDSYALDPDTLLTQRFNDYYSFTGSHFVNLQLTSSDLSYYSGLYDISITVSDESGSGGIIPDGSLEITENGTFDVTNYAQAVVNVSTTGTVEVPGDYHDDLVSINNSIIICAGVALVIYFFYAIYRMFFKGVKS